MRRSSSLGRAAPAAVRARIVTVVVVAWWTLGCEPIGHALEEDVDLLPPVVLGVAAVAEDTVTVTFDEAATVTVEEVAFEPAMGVAEVTAGETVSIRTDGALAIGAEYTLHATARDARGNSTTFVARFAGHNPRPPGLLINEFTTKGSKKRRDAIELYVTDGGNLGGVTLYDGTADDYRDHVVLPPVEVSTGDYVVIHATTDGPGEGATEQAGELDFWMEKGEGLSGNNGVLTLYVAPTGELLDGLLYSNRTSDSDERYRGFGSKATMERADRLVELGGWQIAGTLAAPEDAVSSAATTSTRSLNRDSSSTDTDAAADWHTVPTRGASFGAPNDDRVHE